MTIRFRKMRYFSWRTTCAVSFMVFPCLHSAHAQEQASPDPPLPGHSLAQESAAAIPSTDRFLQSDVFDHRQVQQRTWGIFLGSAAAVGLYGQQQWWQNGFDSRFKQQNEGWFGKNTYSGGADKLGHFFMAYAGTRLSAPAFEWAGNTPDDSLELAALTTLGILSGVEILDGFSKKWKFSKEDAIVNAIGVGTGILMERSPQLDRLFDIRLLYWPSREGGRDFDPFGDYSGQTYLLVAKANALPAFHEHPVLRYLEVAVGYGTRGYSDSPHAENLNGRRHAYFGVSLNVSEVLRKTVFNSPEPRSRTQRVTETFLEFVQVPGTAGLVRHELSGD